MSSSSLSPFPTDASSAEYFEPPHPAWTYGTKVDASPDGKAWAAGEDSGWTVIDAATENPSKMYLMMMSGIGPRPIGMVSTTSEAGVDNLAVFSWFNMVSEDPPLVSLSVSNTRSILKDTATNIHATKEFVASMISLPFLEQANATCVDTPPDVSEWELSGLTKVPSLTVKPPRPKESVFSMECELFQSTDIIHPRTGRLTNTLILGLVKKIHIRNDVLAERYVQNIGANVKTVDPTKYKVVGRMGDITYTTTGPMLRLPRPVWKSEKEIIEASLKTAGLGDSASL